MNVGGAGRTTTETGYYNSAFATKAEITEPQTGYLNDLKVTVQPVDLTQFPGIKIAADKFEKLPKNIRPVKVALKDFCKYMRKCRPTKVLEHLLMGKAKRMLKNQNWGKITPAQSEKALNAITDVNEKENLQNRINDFNDKLHLLNQKKKNLIELKKANDEFREKFKTILAIADGDMTPSLLNLRNNLVIPFPPANPKDDPVCYQLDSKSSVVRKNAARQLKKILKDSEGYQKHIASVNNEYTIKDERQKLKNELTKLSKELKKEYKVVVKSQAEVSKTMLVDQNNERKDQAKEVSDNHKKEVEERNNGVIGDKCKEAIDLNEKIQNMEDKISTIQGTISSNKVRLKNGQAALKRTMQLDSEVKEQTIKEKLGGFDQNSDNQVSQLNELLKKNEEKQQELDGLKNKLREEKANYAFLIKNIRLMESAKSKELQSVDNELRKDEKKFDRETLELQRKLEREMKSYNEETAKMVSGSGLKNKTTPQDESSQPTEDGSPLLTEDGSSQPNS